MEITHTLASNGVSCVLGKALEALRAERLRTGSVSSVDAESHSAYSSSTRKSVSGSATPGRRTNSQPVSIDVILDAVDELVSERYSKTLVKEIKASLTTTIALP